MGFAVLPAVVDLLEAETVGLEFLGGDLGLFDHRLFVRRAGMVPGAVARGLGGKFDVVCFGDVVGPGFQAVTDVVEVADNKGLQARGLGLARRDRKVAIFEMCVDLQPRVLLFGKNHSAAATSRNEAGNNTIVAFRLSDGQPHVTADLLGGALKPASAK